MVRLTINNQKVSVTNGTTIMKAAKKIGIEIPHLCYWEGLNEIGACRVCVVEVKGCEHLVSACNTKCESGMEIFTNSPKVRKARKTNVQLILSQHNCRCATCVRSGNCALQKLANDLNCIRDNSKCVKCMRCVQVCDKIQGLHVWDAVNTGKYTTVNVAGNQKIETANCALCGQCITHCPVGALRERDDVDKVLDELNNPEKITVVQIAPAVRAAWGEGIGLEQRKATEKRLATTLRRIGFDYVFDTNFAADLTIMEEGSEFVEKLKAGDKSKFPMFTSCCPGWMRFAKTQFPEIVGNLSTAKSPMQMFGAMTKSYFAKKIGVDPAKICCVAIMPCLAKKAECAIPVMNSAGAGQDVDYSLTVRELDRLIKHEGILPASLPEENFDSPLGEHTGAAVIFGATGGVMEAALRSAYNLVTGENPPVNAFKGVRGMKAWKEATYNVAGVDVKTAVVHGLENTRKLIEAVKQGEVFYHFVEVMACPGGCVGGGGQPIHEGEEYAELRAPILYKLDEKNPVRFSHENPEVIAAY
ncbi:MAG: [FeFe] hydrogenase, group A, partial [Clostridia bacterium]|nr:[FeFe] hydrogenase, group A [Clostridia bacterium]